MQKTKMRYLKLIDIFQDLSEREMIELDQATTMSTCEKGKIFYRPGETGEVLFLLKKGHVQLYRISADGKKLILSTLAPGTVFGEMSVIGQRMHNSFAEAIEDCLLCIMSRADVERMILTKPRIALRIMETIGQRLVDTEARLEDIAFKSIPARLASLLLRLMAEHGKVIAGYTHQDLAEIIGTYRETATQTLNKFKSDGLIDIGRKRIEILNEKGLHSIAES